jgi:hypothetical protein
VLLVLGEHSFLGQSQRAVKTAQHRHRQHDALVLRWPVGAAQQIGHGPDEVGELLEIGGCHGEGFVLVVQPAEPELLTVTPLRTQKSWIITSIMLATKNEPGTFSVTFSAG